MYMGGFFASDRGAGEDGKPMTTMEDPRGDTGAESGFFTGRLCFGTARLHHLMRDSDRRAVLERAANAGFTHFDTAPFYGAGLAERTLGALLAAEPGLTVATKVGLYPPGGSGSWLGVVSRKAAGRFVPSLSRPIVDMAVARAEESLGDSLSRLRRERADILFLHEPVEDLIDTEAVLTWLDREIARGRIRCAGVAGTAKSVQPFLDGGEVVSVCQTFDSLSGREADFALHRDTPVPITYGYLSAKGGIGSGPAALIQQALERNVRGAVLVATRRLDRVDALAASADPSV